MKNLLMPLLLCIGVLNAIGQNIDSASISRLSPDQQKQYYQLKSDAKRARNEGIIFGVAGLALSIGGFALMSKDFDSLTSGFILALVGAGGTVAGIVNLKIAGSKSNKAKGMIKNQPVARLSPTFSLNKSPAYGFTLTVDF